MASERGHAIGGDLDNPPPCFDSLVPGLEGSSEACCYDSRQLGPGMPADSVGGGLRNSSCKLLSVVDREAHRQTMLLWSRWALGLGSGCPQEPQPGWAAWLSCVKESEQVQ